MSAPDYYKIGTMVDEGEDGDDEVGALVNTPSSILAEMDSVKSMVESLHAAIQAQMRTNDASVRPVFLQEWLRFKAEWEAFYAGNKGWTSRLWGAALEKTEEYKSRVVKWQDAFKKEGVELTGPAFEGPKVFPWKWVLIGGGVVATVVAGAMIAKEVGTTARAFKEAPSDG